MRREPVVLRSAAMTPTATIDAAEEVEFSELADAYRPELLAHCTRMTSSPADSEDLVQETLLRAWRGRGSFEGRAGAASLRSWLYRIATNVCHDALRRRRSRPRLARVPESPEAEGLDWLEVFPSPDPGPASEVADRETVEHALEAALRLPPRQRAVLIMRDVIGLSAKETAALLDASVASVNSSLQRARHGLRAELPEEAHRWR
jgi:RNA polymerase sigma-70 factor (TIGR02960 family)